MNRVLCGDFEWTLETKDINFSLEISGLNMHVGNSGKGSFTSYIPHTLTFISENDDIEKKTKNKYHNRKI